MNNITLQVLQQRLSALAPRIIQFSLNKGAAVADIDKLEKTINKTLPEDFKTLYSTYNGMNDDENLGNLFYGMSFLTIDEIISDYKMRSSITDPLPNLKNCDPEINNSYLYNPGWVTIGTDGSRCRLVVDLSPSEKGTYGQITFIDGDYLVGIFLANSLSTLVNNFIADIGNNLYYLEPDALEDGNHFLETRPAINLANWASVDKWKHLANN
jgi:cell wall assembly regulator SMI1